MKVGSASAGRALVLGSGGVTGIAWTAGVLDGLAAVLAPQDADLVVGTSAGAVVAAHLLAGASASEVVGRLAALAHVGSMDASAAAHLGAVHLARDRPAALRRLGAWAVRRRGLNSEDAWVAQVAGDLVGTPWPATLAVVTTDAVTGRPVVHTASTGTDLGRAVAASCSVAGIFPPVWLAGRPHLDGGFRTLANIDLAAGHGRVLAVTPLTVTGARSRRPGHELRHLPPGTAWGHTSPDAAARRAFGRDPLAVTRVQDAAAHGRRQGREVSDAVAALWAP